MRSDGMVAAQSHAVDDVRCWAMAHGASRPRLRQLSIAVVVPAHQAANYIRACLEGLCQAGFASHEVVVVDDGSQDETGNLARATGVCVIRNEVPSGPAEARNSGVCQVDADIILFCDADVVAHPGARERILRHFALQPGLSAVFGSYDDAPKEQTTVSQYRNLLHHHVHQRSRQDASTFWTGFGAIRRADCTKLGGFDRAWQDIEDVEFGLRLKLSGGRILLDKQLLCTHLKKWTIASMLRTDWKGRAIPWARLVLFRAMPRDDLNLATSHRISAACVAGFLSSIVAALGDTRALVFAAAAIVAFLLANYRFITLLAARRGVGFALSAMPIHVLHYLVALLGCAHVALVEVKRSLLSEVRRHSPAAPEVQSNVPAKQGGTGIGLRQTFHPSGRASLNREVRS